MSPVDLEVRLAPLDPLLFGDNRSARAGVDHALADQDPSPATLYGAIGARIAQALGAGGKAGWGPAAPVLGGFRAGLGDEAPAGAELLGWTLADPAGKRWFPRPLHCRLEEVGESVFALPPLRPAAEADAFPSSLAFPRRLTAADPPDLPPADEIESPLLVEHDLLEEILTAGIEPRTRDLRPSLRAPQALYRPEVRPGLAMDNDSNTAAEGRLFSRPYRRFAGGLGPGATGYETTRFLAWYRVLQLPAGAPASFDGTGFLGGDRRRAELAFTPVGERPLPELHKAVAAAAPESAGWLAYLLTPTLAARPVSLAGREPIAAALGRPFPVSGWDAAAEGPRPILTLIPAGSVFFFTWEESQGPDARPAFLEKYWLSSVAGPYRHAGFGRVLLGVWR